MSTLKIQFTAFAVRGDGTKKPLIVLGRYLKRKDDNDINGELAIGEANEFTFMSRMRADYEKVRQY